MHLQLICMVFVRYKSWVITQWRIRQDREDGVLRMRDTALKIQTRVEFADVCLLLSFRLSAATPPSYS